ncbi:TolC family protein [Methylobacter sp.]|uniref:TolC family protein n=1 Tax=Methylobacter sp. TaxID=2051955 RepID=UPI002FDEC748
MKNNYKKVAAGLLAFIATTDVVYADDIYDLAKVVNATLIQAPEILQQQAAVEGAEAGVKLQTGQFDHTVVSSYTTKLSNSPIISYNQSSFLNLTYLQSYQHLVQAGILKQYRTGISASFSVNVFRKDPINGQPEANAQGLDLTTSNESSVNFQLNIPLLKGATEESAGAAENAAILQYQAAQNDLSFVISSIVLNAINAYWDYKVAVETLEINRISEARVQDWTDKAEQIFILSDPSRAQEMKAKYRAEIDAVLAYLANKHLSVISATQLMEQAKVALSVAMGTPYKDFGLVKVSAEQFPKFEATKLNYEQLNKNWVVQAMEHRADLKAVNLRQEANNVLVKKYTRDLMPQLDVSLNAGYQGLSEGASASTFGDAVYRNVPGPNLGGQLSFAYPLENNVQEGLLARQKALSRSTEIGMGQLERTISALVDVDVSLLTRRMTEKNMAEKAVAFYQPAVNELAERALKNAPTMLNLLEYEDRLVGAKISRLQVESALAKLIAEVRFQTGTLIISNDENHVVDIKSLNAF